MGPYGSENFKTLLLQIAAETFQTFPEFSSQWSSQNDWESFGCDWDFGTFEILKIEVSANFIRFRLHGTQWE